MVAFSLTVPQIVINLSIFYPDEQYQEQNFYHVVGSVVFNMLVILSLCALASSKGFLFFGWKTALRDLLCNLVADVIFLIVIGAKRLRWYHPLLLLSAYASYLAIVWKVEAVVKCCWRRGKKRAEEGKKGVPARGEKGAIQMEGTAGAKEKEGEESDRERGQEKRLSTFFSSNGRLIERCDNVMLHPYRQNRSVAHASSKILELTSDFEERGEDEERESPTAGERRLKANSMVAGALEDDVQLSWANGGLGKGSGADASPSGNNHTASSFSTSADCSIKAPTEQGEKERTSKSLSSSNSPGQRGLLKWLSRALRVVCQLIIRLLRITIPDCESRPSLWPASLLLSIFWICLFDVLLLTWLSKAICLFGLPDSMVAMTFSAAASSTPTAIISWILSRDGFDTMATTVGLGANIGTVLVAQAVLMGAVLARKGSLSVDKLKICSSLMVGSLLIVMVAVMTGRRRVSQTTGKIFIGLYSVFFLLSLLAFYM